MHPINKLKSTIFFFIIFVFEILVIAIMNKWYKLGLLATAVFMLCISITYVMLKIIETREKVDQYPIFSPNVLKILHPLSIASMIAATGVIVLLYSQNIEQNDENDTPLTPSITRSPIETQEDLLKHSDKLMINQTLKQIMDKHDNWYIFEAIKITVIKKSDLDLYFSYFRRKDIHIDLEFADICFDFSNDLTLKLNDNESEFDIILAKYCKNYVFNNINEFTEYLPQNADADDYIVTLQNFDVDNEILNSFNNRQDKDYNFAQWMLDLAFMEISIIGDITFGHIISTLIFFKQQNITNKVVNKLLMILKGMALDANSRFTKQNKINSIRNKLTTFCNKFNSIIPKSDNIGAIRTYNFNTIINWFLYNSRKFGQLEDQLKDLVNQFYNDIEDITLIPPQQPS